MPGKMRAALRATARLVCQECGRQCRYLWRVHRVLTCRACTQHRGVRTLYPRGSTLCSGRYPAVREDGCADDRRTA